MFRVIKSFLFDERMIQNAPGLLEEFGPGLLVTIDAEQSPSFVIRSGSTVRVHRPDGTVIDREVRGIEVFGPKVGLFFQKMEQHEIPISSEIELLGHDDAA